VNSFYIKDNITTETNKNCNNVSFNDFLPQPTRDIMLCSPVTETEIFKLSVNLTTKITGSIQCIGPKLLKEIATEMIEPKIALAITRIQNQWHLLVKSLPNYEISEQ